jgi:hypothetical protein
MRDRSFISIERRPDPIGRKGAASETHGVPIAEHTTLLNGIESEVPMTTASPSKSWGSPHIAVFEIVLVKAPKDALPSRQRTRSCRLVGRD